MIVTEHVWRTANGKFVPPGHVDAAYLAYAPGSEIPDADAQRIGLTDYLLKARAKPEDKARTAPMNKGVVPPTRRNV